MNRYTIISDSPIKLLRRYDSAYKPEKWLFPGEKAGSYISIRSVQEIFKQAADRAGITKEVSVHSLRHSFATHLHEDGVDIRYIQQLPGQKSSKTTGIYTQKYIIHVFMRIMLPAKNSCR